MGTLMRLWLAAALLLTSPAWAAPLPDYVSCNLTWAGFDVYQQTTPTGTPVKVGTVSIPFPYLTFPCPTAQGTYYMSAATLRPDGSTTAIGPPTGFTIKGGAPPPPPLVFAIGAHVTVNAALLNVRSYTPGVGGAVGVIGAVPLGTQPGGAPAQIIGGPVTVPFGTPPVPTKFWQLDYAAGVDGWSAEQGPTGPLLRLVPIP